MKISHVIRAEEHLPNTPKQLHVYQALGFTPPQFAHVSMILAPDRSKLSKRHGATSVQEFRDDGYLPEALVNYLALLGWSPGENDDILPREEMAKIFSLNNVSLSAAIYDINKLAWMNGHYITAADLEAIVKLIEPQARQKGWLHTDNKDYFYKVVDLVRSRAKTVFEVLDLAQYFFEEPQVYDEKGVNKYFRKTGSLDKLMIISDVLGNVQEFTAVHLEETIRLKAESAGLKAADLIHPTRLALSGRTSTPGLFEITELLGRQTSLQRINKAIEYINKLA
jgi:glutamyl-tRNA synthetase